MELITISELIDRLSIVNIKLYNLLDRTAELDAKEKTPDVTAEIVKLSGDNIRLVKQRSQLKIAIDQKIAEVIRQGRIDILDEVKDYGSVIIRKK